MTVDFTVALASASQALTIVKQLREIDKGVSEGELKASMADLYGKVAELRMALTDAREEIHEKDRQIKSLRDQIAAHTSGEACPICREGKMEVISSKKDPVFGVMGVQLQTLKCGKCGHSEEHQYDPMGRQ
ncbi:chromosome segregation ATPase [Rhodopseudomonas rhenobacensis]|uniref:Chromosome segregation ATPase n=1 Tax=Rhodopseudomonas rhenobacensis TaxID=87461 RepID=A0A7W7Z183_9BRAD|nr:hypothetical protein [Rhodopseudomonas rhenobacensis]MBB5046150.1 chromosome segregation ATPase [Rhodopseudomonas rhenobacensis]